MKKSSEIFNVLIALALFLAGMSTQPVLADSVITVNTDADNTTAGDTFCTLREAINNANADADTTSGDCVAGSGVDEIVFAGNYTITLAGIELPALTTELTITGNGAANTIIQANASPNTATYGVFEVVITGNVTLDGLTVQNGGGIDARGGGIFNNVGTLTITNSVIYNNRVTGVSAGGGIAES